MKNGNTVNKISIIHWNMGSRLWENKLEELELLLSEKKPDLCFISEANISASKNLDEMNVPGHQLILPRTMSRLGHARIALVVKNHFNVHILNEYMHDDIASIWVRIGDNKKQSIVVGGLYREHSILGEDISNLTNGEKQAKQEERWRKLVTQWRRAGVSNNCVIIGDINLNFLDWEEPESGHENMIELVKDNLETTGFTQIVKKYTRSMSNQRDSLIDHIWTNKSTRILRHFNEVRNDSDHNVIGVDVSKKDVKIGGFNVKRRSWTNFDKDRFLTKVKNIDWKDILEDYNVDTANSKTEERLREVIDSEAPMSVIQMRSRYNKWI